jgi:hypothetical protein
MHTAIAGVVYDGASLIQTAHVAHPAVPLAGVSVRIEGNVRNMFVCHAHAVRSAPLPFIHTPYRMVYRCTLGLGWLSTMR